MKRGGSLVKEQIVKTLFIIGRIGKLMLKKRSSVYGENLNDYSS